MCVCACGLCASPCSLLLRRECCSFSNGEFIKAGVQELDQWLEAATPEYAGTAPDELKCIRQAVDFLVWPLLARVWMLVFARLWCTRGVQVWAQNPQKRFSLP